MKELVKWEMEVFDRKTEERFKHIETSLKSSKIKSEDDVGALRLETLGEFENLKGQFEEFGNSVYDRITQDLLS